MTVGWKGYDSIYMSQLLHQHCTGGTIVRLFLQTLANYGEKQLLLLCSAHFDVMFTVLQLIQCNELIPSALCGGPGFGVWWTG